MSRHIRPWKIDQTQLCLRRSPITCRRIFRRFVVALAREGLDLSEVIGSYKSDRKPPAWTAGSRVAADFSAFRGASVIDSALLPLGSTKP
jgi:hypothetical protein